MMSGGEGRRASALSTPGIESAIGALESANCRGNRSTSTPPTISSTRSVLSLHTIARTAAPVSATRPSERLRTTVSTPPRCGG
jgi:hypothetical protein